MSDLIERLREKARHLNTTTANLIIEAADELSRLQSLSDQNRLTGGWRAVPEEPTSRMIDAGIQARFSVREGQTAAMWAAMLAASPPLPDTGGWRDIESAPKDGTAVLVWSSEDTSVASHDGGGWLALVDGEWVVENVPNTGNQWIEVYPTHWQPLPSPPLPLPGGEEKR